MIGKGYSERLTMGPTGQLPRLKCVWALSLLCQCSQIPKPKIRSVDGATADRKCRRGPTSPRCGSTLCMA